MENLIEQWRKACEHEGIDPTSMFVVFSDDNPYIKEYNRLVGIAQKCMKNGKAVITATQSRRHK